MAAKYRGNGGKRRSINADTLEMMEVAHREGIETVWDRLEAQEPHCGFCSGGSAAHNDHGRDILETLHKVGEGKTDIYKITDGDKLRRLAAEYGIETDSHDDQQVAAQLASAMMDDFGMGREKLPMAARAPQVRQEIWEKAGTYPRGIDREIVEALHRTTMGVDNDWINILLHAVRTSLSDGYGGSMIATELSDVLFGTPSPRQSTVNLGVLKADEVNVVLHGHNPMLSEVIVAAATDAELNDLAKEKGAKGINLAGLCCTGNEVLMRKGIPMAGNHLMQELCIMTGAVEAMVVDYQCIMPAVTETARCYHTKVISTFDKAKFPGAQHISFQAERALEIGKETGFRSGSTSLTTPYPS
jgi:carbon-monoxide dehydrogenase catalytic subunit